MCTLILYHHKPYHLDSIPPSIPYIRSSFFFISILYHTHQTNKMSTPLVSSWTTFSNTTYIDNILSPTPIPTPIPTLFLVPPAPPTINDSIDKMLVLATELLPKITRNESLRDNRKTSTSNQYVKPVELFNPLSSATILKFHSIKEAAGLLGMDNGDLSRCLRQGITAIDGLHIRPTRTSSSNDNSDSDTPAPSPAQKRSHGKVDENNILTTKRSRKSPTEPDSVPNNIPLKQEKQRAKAKVRGREKTKPILAQSE